MSSAVPKKSPLRYPGGKTRACKVLESILIEKFGIPHKLYSPFYGGGSFELYMNGKHNTEIYAGDGFGPLANFWKMVKYRPEDLTQEVKTLKPLTKDRFTNIRQCILGEIDELKQAAYYFALNRCSFSGATLSGGFSKESENTRFNDSAIERMRSCNMTGVEVCHQNFVEFLHDIGDMNETEVIYLDPPYYVESKLYGVHGDMHEGFQHELLAEELKKKKRWLLCYNDCDYIRKLYQGYEIRNVSWSYGMNKSKASSEIVILCT